MILPGMYVITVTGHDLITIHVNHTLTVQCPRSIVIAWQGGALYLQYK